MNSCYTYFAIKGDFKTEDISNLLGLSPTREHNIGELRKNGTSYDFSLWEYGKCDKYDVDVTNQMRETIKNLVPLKEKLIYIKEQYDAVMVLEVVPKVYPDETTPVLAPTRDVIEFLYETGTALDIDLYICESEKK